MTTVIIDDQLAMRLRALRDGDDDFNLLVAEALAASVRRWEWEATGRAEMRAMLDGQRCTPAKADARTRRQYGCPDFSHLTVDELPDQSAATLTELPPEKVAEAYRLSLA